METKEKTIGYPLRLPEHLLELARLRSREEKVQLATALRQLLRQGAEKYVLELVSAGRISLGLGAELLDVPVYRLYDLAQEYGVEIGTTPAQARQSKISNG